MEQFKTTNYNQFKTIRGNRPVNAERVKQLAARIKNKNHLDLFPIVVNEKMEVIDGQTRLEAAQRLGIPIEYKQKVGLRVTDVAELNTSQKPWKVLDYVNLHISQGLKDYLELKEFAAIWKLPLTASASILSKYQVSQSQRASFNEGTWGIEDTLQGTAIAQFMSDLQPFMRNRAIYRTSSFASAAKRTYLIALEKNFDLKTAVTRAQGSNLVITHTNRVTDYLRDIESIINYGKTSGRLRLI